MRKRTLASIFVSLLSTGVANAADSCTTLQAEIDAKIRAAGVVNYTLVTVDADADATEPGRFVGSCGNGRKKIVYSQIGAPGGSGVPSGASLLNPAGASAKLRGPAMLTECRPGYTGADCKQRVTPAPVAADEKKVPAP